MMAICPVCDKLTHAAAAPRDPLGCPRVRIGEHEQEHTVTINTAVPADHPGYKRERSVRMVRCHGSGRHV